MPTIYSQRRGDRNIAMIGRASDIASCKEVVAAYALEWINSKKGRKVKPISTLEMGLHFSDGKLAALLWVDPVVSPVGENPFTPATGPIPGLTVQP